MEKFYKDVIYVFDYAVEFIILFIEIIGVAVLLVAIVRAIIDMARKKERVRLNLAEGIALALEFKMGSELLRTLVVREWKELLILGSIILLRAALTFLIQWEIKIERKNSFSQAEESEEAEQNENE